MSSADPHEPAPFRQPREGDILAGKFRIEKILGKGGMGLVVAAEHLQLGQRVAIKFLFQPGNRETVARFLREARAAVRLRSEHVARVIDVGELENGAPYMVMEHLRGDDLQQHVRTHGPLPVTDAVDYVLQTSEAIAEAHAAGIVHRDLKPANLFLTTTPDGSKSIKVLDFGISKASAGTDDQGSDGMQLTKTEVVLGSPLYMSPEQLRSSRDVDARADIWALGVVLYQLLTGKVPFNTTVFSELILKVNLEAPTPLSTYRDDLPPSLESAILRCLEKKAEDRFQTVGELALAIAEHGPSTARISAEKAVRVLEAAGQTVVTPPGVVRGASGPLASNVTAAPLATSAAAGVVPGATVVVGPTAARAASAAAESTASSGVATAAGEVSAVVAQTAVGSLEGQASVTGVAPRAPAPAPAAASGKRGLGVGLVAALLVGAVVATVLVLRLSPGKDGAGAAASSEAGASAAPPPTGPDVRPTSDPSAPASAPVSASSTSPSPAASASDTAASGSASATVSPRPTATPRGTAGPATPKPSSQQGAPSSAATPNSPFSKAGDLGNKY